MRKIKVLQVAAVEFPPDSRIERSIQTLKKAGYDVDLLCLRNPKDNIEIWEGCKIHRLPFSESNLPTPMNWIVDYILFTILGTLYVYFLALKERYNIIHYNNPPDFMVPLLFPLKLVGTRIVYDAHEITHLLLESRLRGNLAKVSSSIMNFFQKLAMGSADMIITVSELAKKELHKLCENKKIIVVENTLMEIPYIKKQQKTNRGKIIFSYVGSFLEDRDIDTLLKAFQEITNNKIELWLVGGKLETKDKRIKTFGKVPHKKALQLYANSDVALITLANSPINRISNSNRLYEAMALGKAIICANLPGPRSILKNTGVYYIPGDVSSLKIAMEKFIKNPRLVKEYGEKARKLFLREYTWDKIGGKLLLAYKQVLGR